MIKKIYAHYLKTGCNISTDSRNILPGSIFFALKGENFDGNKFAHDAIKIGASLSVIDNKEYQSENTVLVDDCLLALQQMAAMHRKESNFKVLAITGTNGKTTTKELIKLVLSKKYNAYATAGNLNNHIGVPLTILSTPRNTEILILEMGANHQGEIANLCNIAEPDFGLITNIGKAHLEGFGSYQGVIKAKSELYRFLIKNKKRIFINSSDKVLLNIIGDYSTIESYGGLTSTCGIEHIEFDGLLIAHLIIKNQKYAVKTQLFGKYNAINLLAAFSVGLYFKVDIIEIIDALQSYKPENNRSQILKTSSNTLILDSYNANPSSMELALDSLKEIISEKKIAVLGEMKELGKSSIEEHQKLINLAKQLKDTQTFFVGEGFNTSLLNQEEFFNNTEDLIDFLKLNKPANSLIFIKGSRANQLEKIVEFL